MWFFTRPISSSWKHPLKSLRKVKKERRIPTCTWDFWAGGSKIYSGTAWQKLFEVLLLRRAFVFGLDQGEEKSNCFDLNRSNPDRRWLLFDCFPTLNTELICRAVSGSICGSSQNTAILLRVINFSIFRIQKVDICWVLLWWDWGTGIIGCLWSL